MLDSVKKLSFSEREQEILQFWKEENIFSQSIEQREGAPCFSFYDGPPFATGLPHYGHLLAGTIKDVVLRYKTMKGFYVPRRFGWDCHGLPVEHEVEKQENLSGADAVEAFGIARYNEVCESIVLRYTREWESTVTRMGRWVDFSHCYKTMDLPFMESVWWVFKQLYEKGLIYEGYKVMPFSPTLGTPLSNFEAGENYKEVDDPAITVAFHCAEKSKCAFLAWTTTPWTLPSNLALAVGEDLSYVRMHDPENDFSYILAEKRVGEIDPQGKWKKIESYSARELVGMHYTPLFSYFAHRQKEGAFRLILSDHVTVDEGTGIVHMAPAFGEEDFFVCQKEKINPVCPVDNNGHFTEEVVEYAGMFVKEADRPIIQRLKREGKLLRHSTVRHRYPYCYRSDTPLIYRTMKTWFLRVESIKKELFDCVREIQWTPQHIKEGRFGHWVAHARDWAISRNRYWGTPLPIWRAEDGEIHVMGSVSELEEYTGKKVENIHRHHIDSLTFVKNGKTFCRVSEVLDCWFESGSMPYAQNHYPFERKKEFISSFPCDFIAEGLDQTRGWFYTLNVLSTAIFQKPAFKNVIVNGILLAEDGCKMSKRLKNYPQPEEVIEQYGADAIRLYLLNSGAVRAENLCFSRRGVELTLRKVLIPLWNAYHGFFLTYARIYNWKPQESLFSFQPILAIDRWILSLLHQLIDRVEKGLQLYDLSQAVSPLVSFIDQLTNWYIRRNRRRFWEEEDAEGSLQQESAFSTLYIVLIELTKLLAPFTPFISESIYRNLRVEGTSPSVHLCDYPLYEERKRDLSLEKRMKYAQQVVSLGHALRKKHQVKVRQPLPTMIILSNDEEVIHFLKKENLLIAEELNVKEILFSSQEKDYLSFSIKPNFPILGKKVGKRMREVQKKISSLQWEEVEPFLKGGALSLRLEGKKEEETVTLTAEDLIVERSVKEGSVAATEEKITVVMDTKISEELRREGIAREVVNKINTMRRENNYAVTDRISLLIGTENHILQEEVWKEYGKYILEETLTTAHRFTNFSDPALEREGRVWDINGIPICIAIQSVASLL